MLSLKKHRGPLIYFKHYNGRYPLRLDPRDNEVYRYRQGVWVKHWVHRCLRDLIDTAPRTVIKDKAYYIDLLDRATAYIHRRLQCYH